MTSIASSSRTVTRPIATAAPTNEERIIALCASVEQIVTRREADKRAAAERAAATIYRTTYTTSAERILIASDATLAIIADETALWDTSGKEYLGLSLQFS
ncbi:hypothetical protein GGI17_006355 [Coemansia sp. S146]|nr:hypothetical protein GGI17_006355 [Coemansia sp. S146]